jgi:hypothetical protein
MREHVAARSNRFARHRCDQPARPPGARDDNAHVRRATTAILSTSLAGAIKMPVPTRRPAG